MIQFRQWVYIIVNIYILNKRTDEKSFDRIAEYIDNLAILW